LSRLPARGHDGAREQDDASPETGQDGAASIGVRLDALLELRGMTLTELSERVGVTIVNLSILKNGRARAVRFSTLARLCQALDCQPGDLLVYQHTPARPADPA
jgi:putative transcriptional regulator